MRQRIVAIFATCVFLLGALSARAAERAVESWMTTAAVQVPASAFDEIDLDAASQWLDEAPVDAFYYWPELGNSIAFSPLAKGTFAANKLSFTKVDGAPFQVAAAATYLSSPAWQKGTLKVRGAAPFVLYFDGEKSVSRTSVGEADAEETAEITIDQGHHRLLLFTALNGDSEVENWAFEVTCEQSEGTDEAWLPNVTLDAKHPFDIADYFLQDKLSAMELSSDGRTVAMIFGEWDRRDASTDSWIEVWDVRKKNKVWTYRTNGDCLSIEGWSPDNSMLLMKAGSSLFVWDRQTFEMTLVTEDAGGFWNMNWAPDGKGFYFAESVEAEENDKPYKVMWDLRDRWWGWRNDTAIKYMALDGDKPVTITTMHYSLDGMVISPDNSTLYVLRMPPAEERPFRIFEIWSVSTKSGEAKKIWADRYQSLGGFALSPDGKTIAFAAPRVPVTGNDNQNPDTNYYDRDLYMLDVATGVATNVDEAFPPSVAIDYYGTGKSNDFVWHDDGTLLFHAVHNKKAFFCSYNPKKGHIDNWQLTTSGFSNLTAATDKGSHTVLFHGDKVNDRGNIYTYDLKRRKGKLFMQRFEDLHRLTEAAPRIEDYDYVNEEGVTIYGYLYYPRDYDPTKKYPLIVDTYGGVIGFGDGWLWASQVFANRGYFCYVPAPRGAAGYGTEYADTHVNDWGEITSRDMNRGVRHIVANVEGVAGDKVGFVSGSYGGFLAMYLLAMDKDNPDFYPYATTISDYGISNLASYWGVGNWGYYYCDMASAGSFPWNRPDYYQKWSPLFHADNITSPLLLLHGDSDTNVPVMESEQMYTALKLLGREVEFIRFPGEDHGIAGDRTSYVTSKRMHLEWFDKYLRDRPGAWEERMNNEHKK